MPDNDATPDVLDTLPAELLEQAAAAAEAVFDRRLKLMAPHRVFVDEAIAAAAPIVTAPLADRHRALVAALKDVVTAANTDGVPTVVQLCTIRDRAVAALLADLP